MFKQTNKSEKETILTSTSSNTLDAITAEQHTEFAKLTGKLDVNFKVGKASDDSAGKGNSN